MFGMASEEIHAAGNCGWSEGDKGLIPESVMNRIFPKAL